MSETRAVVGRKRELSFLEKFLEAVPEGPVGLLIEGEVGIGKTTLWREAAAAAAVRGRSYRVLACRPVESETQLAFSALGDLLEDVQAESLSGLPEPQRRALEVALLRREADGPAPRSGGVARPSRRVCSLAKARPVVVAVDDVPWLDRPSASALEFVLVVSRGPIGLLVARGGGWRRRSARSRTSATGRPLRAAAVDRSVSSTGSASPRPPRCHFHRPTLLLLQPPWAAMLVALEIAGASSGATYR
jgi:hypothetical protein